MKKVLLFILFVIPFVFIGANAQAYDMFDIYMQPRIMAEDGSIEIAVRIRNVESAIAYGFDGVSEIRFTLDVDTEAFVVADEPVSFIDGGLIVVDDDILVNVDYGTVSVIFSDASLGDRLITQNGYLFNLNVWAVNPRGFFHSPYTYPIAFDQDSVEVTIFQTYSSQIQNVYNVNAWDVDVGGQVFPTLLPQLGVSIADEIAVNWSPYTYRYELYADSQVVYVDVPPFVEQGELMVPVRHIANAAGAGVAWRGADRTAVVATPENLTVMITETFDFITINGVEFDMSRPAEIRYGRIFIPHSSAVKIFPTLLP